MNQVDHHRLRVFVLIDALGWSYLQGRKFLENELPYRVPLRTVLGFSSGAIPTILTGLRPAQHGHWNLFYYDPAGSPFRWLRHFAFLPDGVLESGHGALRLRKVQRQDEEKEEIEEFDSHIGIHGL